MDNDWGGVEGGRWEMVGTVPKSGVQKDMLRGDDSAKVKRAGNST